MSFHRIFYCILFTSVLFVVACNKPGEEETEYTDPFPFPELPENNSGNKARSITYVYDLTPSDNTYPIKKDSSVILFSYDSTDKINRIRLTYANAMVYDFSFERNGNKLTGIHCNSWGIDADSLFIQKSDLELQYTGGNVSLMRAIFRSPTVTQIDSFIIKSTGNRIDTIIDRTYAWGTNVDKYAFTYNGSGDIIQMDEIRTSGIYFSYMNRLKYTLSNSPAAAALGNEALFWYFYADNTIYSGNTALTLPSILFHSSKQPSKLELLSGSYNFTSNYQTEYYPLGRLKKMTANVITQTGALHAREAYYYSYTQ